MSIVDYWLNTTVMSLEISKSFKITDLKQHNLSVSITGGRLNRPRFKYFQMTVKMPKEITYIVNTSSATCV